MAPFEEEEEVVVVVAAAAEVGVLVVVGVAGTALEATDGGRITLLSVFKARTLATFVEVVAWG